MDELNKKIFFQKGGYKKNGHETTEFKRCFGFPKKLGVKWNFREKNR